MDKETFKAVQAEVSKVAEGMMNAMAVLGLLIYSSGNITKAEFLDLSGKAASSCRTAGDVFGAALLAGMCKRLEAFEKDPPGSQGRKEH